MVAWPTRAATGDANSLGCLKSEVRGIERDHALELTAFDLPGPGHREGVQEAHKVRDLVVGHRITGELLELIPGDDGSLDGNDAGADQLPEHFVRDADHGDVVDGGVGSQLIFDLARIDLISAADDRVLAASHD